MRGQALVEFALVLPILLLLLLGSMQVGVALLVRYQLEHAVSEAAIAGATAASQPERCPAALAALAEVYRGSIQDAACVPSSGTAIQVTARVDLLLFIPAPTDHWSIEATGRAIVR